MQSIFDEGPSSSSFGGGGFGFGLAAGGGESASSQLPAFLQPQPDTFFTLPPAQQTNSLTHQENNENRGLFDAVFMQSLPALRSSPAPPAPPAASATRESLAPPPTAVQHHSQHQYQTQPRPFPSSTYSPVAPISTVTSPSVASVTPQANMAAWTPPPFHTPTATAAHARTPVQGMNGTTAPNGYGASSVADAALSVTPTQAARPFALQSPLAPSPAFAGHSPAAYPTQPPSFAHTSATSTGAPLSQAAPAVAARADANLAAPNRPPASASHTAPVPTTSHSTGPIPATTVQHITPRTATHVSPPMHSVGPSQTISHSGSPLALNHLPTPTTAAAPAPTASNQRTPTHVATTQPTQTVSNQPTTRVTAPTAVVSQPAPPSPSVQPATPAPAPIQPMMSRPVNALASTSNMKPTATPNGVVHHASAPLAHTSHVPPVGPVAAVVAVDPERKQQLLSRAHTLFQRENRRTRALEREVRDLRAQLREAHHQLRQQQQVRLAPVLPTPPTFSADPEDSPLTSTISGSADPTILALLDNSAAIDEALARKRALTEQMLATALRVETLVREQADRETERENRERAQRATDAAARTNRMRGRWHAEEGEDGEDDLKPPSLPTPMPTFADSLSSPLVTSLTSHIGALQHANSLTQSLLTLKNHSLSQQQEQQSLLHSSLRAQISDLASAAERRERENREERETLVGNLKNMIDMLAKENEELRQQVKDGRNGGRQDEAPTVRVQETKPLPLRNFESDGIVTTLNGLANHAAPPPPPAALAYLRPALTPSTTLPSFTAPALPALPPQPLVRGAMPPSFPAALPTPPMPTMPHNFTAHAAGSGLAMPPPPANLLPAGAPPPLSAPAFPSRPSFLPPPTFL